MPIDRRQFLVLAAGVLATACGGSSAKGTASASTTTGPATTSGAPASSASGSTAATSTTTSSTTTAAPTGPARYVNRGATTGSRVALTFHPEGTRAQVTRLLDMTAGLQAPITTMIVGKWVEQFPDLGRRIADAGHDVGNHTYSHLSLPDQPRDVVAREIRAGADAIRKATGTPGRWFRPSGSNSTTALIDDEAGKAGYPVVLGFDVDPLDYQDPGAAAVRTRTVSGAHPGAIVSLHAQHDGTLDTFEALVQGLRAKGFTLVRASDIVA